MVRKLSNDELNRLSAPGFRASEKMPVVLVLDNLRSMNNTGSIFRTADAFRVEKICLCGITGSPPHREIQKTALGATESVIWEYFPDTLEAVLKLKSEGFYVIGVEQTNSGMMLQSFFPDHQKKYAFVFGNEINGVSPEVIDKMDAFIEIPQFGIKHSFNVSVSTGIVLWHFFLRKDQQKRAAF
jgi:23S rRNA (guanosine2251-2'-O)-methyltransferase